MTTERKMAAIIEKNKRESKGREKENNKSVNVILANAWDSIFKRNLRPAHFLLPGNVLFGSTARPPTVAVVAALETSCCCCYCSYHRRKMRITPTKVVNLITGFVLLVLVYSIFNHSSADHRNYDSTCDVSKEYQTKLHRLVYKAHDILDGELTGTIFLQHLFSFCICIINPGFYTAKTGADITWYRHYGT